MQHEKGRLCPNSLQAVKALLDDYLVKNKFPGYACLISQFGSEVSYFQGGKMDVESDKSMSRDTLYRIYSMTKPLTSIAAMQLIEQGRFKLDDPVERFIPSWKHIKVFSSGSATNFKVVAPDRSMTVKDLMTHTSGLTYGFQHAHAVDEIYRSTRIDDLTINWDLDHRIQLLSEIPLQFSPGSRWNYSISTDVLGYLIEQIAQESLGSYIKRRITDPLGMRDTGFRVEKIDQHRLAACYQYDASANWFSLEDSPDSSRYLEDPPFYSGGGGLVSTIDDYNRFAHALLGHGQHKGVRILGSRTLEYMITNHLPGNRDLAAMGQPVFAETPFSGVGFGLGFSIMMDPVKANSNSTVGEYGWGGAASTYFWVDPIKKITVVFMTQLIPSNSYPIRRELKNAVYQALG